MVPPINCDSRPPRGLLPLGDDPHPPHLWVVPALDASW